MSLLHAAVAARASEYHGTAMYVLQMLCFNERHPALGTCYDEQQHNTPQVCILTLCAVQGTFLCIEAACCTHQHKLSGTPAHSLAQHALQGWRHRHKFQQVALLPHTRAQHTQLGHLQSCTPPRIRSLLHIQSSHTVDVGQTGFWQLQQQLHQAPQQLAKLEDAEADWSPNPLYRLGSYDPAQHSQEQQPAQQHWQTISSIPNIALQPKEVAVPPPAHMQISTEQHAGSHSRLRPSGAAQPLVQGAAATHCCQHCLVQTAQLTGALVDANARVSTAREQLLAAQADINMLIGKATCTASTGLHLSHVCDASDVMPCLAACIS